jgi:hypothetical protein
VGSRDLNPGLAVLPDVEGAVVRRAIILDLN